MTKITFYKKNGRYFGFYEEGHTGYDFSGEDILCSALSAMTMLVVNTAEICYAGDIVYDYNPDAATVKVKCLTALSEKKEDEKKVFAISGLFEGYLLQLTDLLEDYEDYLDVDEKECDDF